MLSEQVRQRIEALLQEAPPSPPPLRQPFAGARPAVEEARSAGPAPFYGAAPSSRPSHFEPRPDGLAARLSQLISTKSTAKMSAATGATFPERSAADGDFSLATLIPGEVVETAAGPHYCVARELPELGSPPVAASPSLGDADDARDSGAAGSVTSLGSATFGTASLFGGPADAVGAEQAAVSGHSAKPARPERPHPELTALGRHFPEKALLLDLETCGFAGSMVFLIGVVHIRDGSWRLEQWLARDYREEGPLLESFWRLAEQCEVLVTFNGKTFDWPMLRDRGTYHRLGPSRDSARAAPRWVHCDVLHHARRRWRRVLPNCRLQTLERYLCGRVRRGDIPGSQIPAAYHGFVRDGDARLLRQILHHNALDLITLAQVALRLKQASEETAAAPVGSPARRSAPARPAAPASASTRAASRPRSAAG